MSIPVGVKDIGEWAFGDCKQLSGITIPDSVVDIRGNPFTYSNAITSINVDAANTVYSSSDGMLLNKSGSKLIACPGGKASCIIPAGVNSIEPRAFEGSNTLQNIIIPAAVSNIGDNAFLGCIALNKATIYSKTATLGNNIFTSTAIASDGIYGYNGSTMQVYASANSIPFHILYTVTFNSQNGSAVSDVIVTAGTAISAPVNPTRTGFQFDGWYPTSACDTLPVTFPYTVNADTPFYAKWKENPPATVSVGISCQKTDVTLYGAANGSITITATGGNSGAYLYSIDGGATWQSTNIFSEAAGTYMAAACDAGNKANIATQSVTLGQPALAWTGTANKMPASVKAGTAWVIKPPATPKGYTLKFIKYVSGSKQIAFIDPNGNATFLKGGSVKITVTMVYQKGTATKTVKIQKQVKVNQLVSKIKLNASSATVAVKKKLKLKVTVTPTSATNKAVKWTSSNPKVAAVSAVGVVTGKTKGTAVITCTARDGSKISANCSVTVN